MTESVANISPIKTSYRSQIQTRIASPRSLSAVTVYPSLINNRNHDDQILSNEKAQLKKLNDQFLSYIERVRLCETYNKCLTLHCDHIKTTQDDAKEKLDSLKQEFDEYQQEKYNREIQESKLENEHMHEIEKQVNECKNRRNFLQHEHELNRQQIIDMQQQSIDIQTKTEKLRFEYENLNEDSNHCRKQVSYYQILKSSILDEISRQRDMHQRLQLEVDDLKVQKQLTIQTHEADVQAVQIRNDNIFYDLSAQFRLDGNEKSMLTQTLNEIREEYKMKDNQMREELHKKYLIEYNQHKKKLVDQNSREANREYIERQQLSNELNSLNDNRSLLREKINLVQEHYKQLELNFQRERNRQKDMCEKYDNEIKKLNLSIQEYENLLNDKAFTRPVTIEDEVKKYRQLLEGSEQQKGLRQLVSLSSKIDRLSPIPHSSVLSTNKSESVSTILTRRNSTSETSYTTAPALSTTTTNQQYVTFNSANEKLVQNDYDTDNDQSQTIQCVSGRTSRLISETDLTSTNQDLLQATDSMKYDETINEISIIVSQVENQINETLPFIPMNIVLPTDTNENKTIITDEQQSPLISTFEKREEVNQTNIEPNIITSSETIIPITIEIDTTINDELNEAKILSPSASLIPINEPVKAIVSLSPVLDHTVTESTIVEVPVSTLPAENPLAKLMSAMLPNAPPFVPSTNVATINQPDAPISIPISNMNNDAPPFIPSQHQPNVNQQNMNNTAGGHWGGRGAPAGNNRRGQHNSGGNFHHGGGNQRSGGGGNWQQGNSHQKQRRGPK